jgi:hypothetical protein
VGLVYALLLSFSTNSSSEIEISPVQRFFSFYQWFVLQEMRALHNAYVSQKSLHISSSLSSRLSSGTTRAVQRKHVCGGSLYLALPVRIRGVLPLRRRYALIFSWPWRTCLVSILHYEPATLNTRGNPGVCRDVQYPLRNIINLFVRRKYIDELEQGETLKCEER